MFYYAEPSRTKIWRASPNLLPERWVAAKEAAGADFGEVHHLVSGANQEKAWSTGDIDAGMVTVGMSGGLIHDATHGYNALLAFALASVVLGMIPFLVVPALRR